MSLSAVPAACVCPLTPVFVSFLRVGVPPPRDCAVSRAPHLLAGSITAVALPRARMPAVLGAAAA